MKPIDWIKPNIYDQFQCKGGTCRRTCCAGWRITVSKSEYQDLKKKLNREEAGTLQRLPEHIRSTRMYGEFILDQKGCRLQTEEGLCGLQLSMGADALPDVCTYFPRHGARCDAELQVSLSPACEAVLELLLEQEGPLQFIRQQAPVAPIPQRSFSGAHGETKWKEHLQLQEFCLLLLQAEESSMDQRMALLGIGLHQIDMLYQKGERRKAAGYMDQYLTMLSETEDPEALLPSEHLSPVFLLGNFVASTTFDFSRRYPKVISQVERELQVTVHTNQETGKPSFSYSPEAYEQKRELFRRFTARHPYFLENLMVMLFVMKGWASLPDESHSIWNQYMYACWVYSNLKFTLTACMKENSSDNDLVDIGAVLLRSWVHGLDSMTQVLKQLHDNHTDTPAHMAMMVQAG